MQIRRLTVGTSVVSFDFRAVGGAQRHGVRIEVDPSPGTVAFDTRPTVTINTDDSTDGRPIPGGDSFPIPVDSVNTADKLYLIADTPGMKVTIIVD